MLNRICKSSRLNWVVFYAAGIKEICISRFRFPQHRICNSLIGLWIVALLGNMPSWAFGVSALPVGAQIANGQVSIQESPSGHQLNINQTTEQAIIDWDAFNVGQHASVHFKQPSPQAVILNRVPHGTSPSEILGKIEANGHVFIVNPDGVLVGASGQFNISSLSLATLDISNDDFLENRYYFNGQNQGHIVNRGQIVASEGGQISLFGSQVFNQEEGKIIAHKGGIYLIAGSEVIFESGHLSSTLLSTIQRGIPDAKIENKGILRADSGQIQLDARSSDINKPAIVSHFGLIEARTLKDAPLGKIIVRAEGGQLHVSGTLDAVGRQSDGGTIETMAETVQIDPRAKVTTESNRGKGGLWQLGAAYLSVVDDAQPLDGNKISASILSRNFGKGGNIGNMMLKAYAGDIEVNAPIKWDKNELIFHAYGHIHINATLEGSKKAQLAFEYGQPEGKTDHHMGDYILAPGVKINLPQGPNFRTRWGSNAETQVYQVITRLKKGSKQYVGLQDIKKNLSGNYVLGSDIDAIVTRDWHSQEGWKPLGIESSRKKNEPDSVVPFTGRFDGFGHTISGLYIHRPASSHVGLFAQTSSATLRSLHLVGADVSGDDYVGALVGQNIRGEISQCYTIDSKVTGHDHVGQVFGANEQGLIRNSTIPANHVPSQIKVDNIIADNPASDAHHDQQAVQQDASMSVPAIETEKIGNWVVEDSKEEHPSQAPDSDEL